MKRVLPIAAIALLAACSANEGTDASNAAAMNDGVAMEAMPMNDMMMMAPAPGDSPATQGYKRSMSAMMTDMPAYTGDADVDFMQQMRGHHSAAVAMSETQLANGKDAEARALAEKIIAEQKTEIAQIDRWLAARP